MTLWAQYWIPRFKRDGLKRRAQLMVKASNQIQIRHALLNLRWLGRLRELFYQGKLVGAGFVGDCIAREPFLRKQVIQYRSCCGVQRPFDSGRQLLILGLNRTQDLIG